MRTTQMNPGYRNENNHKLMEKSGSLKRQEHLTGPQEDNNKYLSDV